MRKRNEVIARTVAVVIAVVIAIVIAVERDGGVVLNGRNRSGQALYGNGISGNIVLAASIELCRYGVAAGGRIGVDRQLVGRNFAVAGNFRCAKSRARFGRVIPSHVGKSAVNLVALLVRKRKGKIDRRTARCRNIRIIIELIGVLLNTDINRLADGSVRSAAFAQRAGNRVSLSFKRIGNHPLIFTRSGVLGRSECSCIRGIRCFVSPSDLSLAARISGKGKCHFRTGLRIGTGIGGKVTRCNQLSCINGNDFVGAASLFKS